MPRLDLALGVASGGARAVAPVPLSVPSGFSWTPPITVSRIGSGAASTFTTNWDYEASKPAPNATIYVDAAGGNNANDGLTYANRVRSLSTAITKANALAVAVVRILANPGNYFQAMPTGTTLNDHFNGTAPTCDLIIEPNNVEGGPGEVFTACNFTSAVSWTLVSGSFYKTTSLGTTSNRVLTDLTSRDAYNDPAVLFRVLSVANPADPTPELAAAAAANPGRGAVYRNTGTSPHTWTVLLHDGRAPDNNVLATSSSHTQLTITSAANRRVWIKGVHIQGAGRAVLIDADLATVTHQFYAKDCSFNGVDDNNIGGGLAWTDGAGLCILQNCRANYNARDGFNYHGGSTSAANCPTRIEIDCVAIKNGWMGGGADNGTTLHEACRGIVVNGLYQSRDRVIHHIADAQDWILGATLQTPDDTASVDGFIKAGELSGDDVRLWLDAVRFGALNGSQFTIECLTDSIVRTANMDPTGWVTPGAGLITTYAA